jgi:hypothetical protein
MVINPETGIMHEFKPDKQVLGEKGVNLVTGKESDVTELSHHSSVLAGKGVTGAGSFQTDDEGKLTQITNKSGHYKPGVAKLVQSVETLLRQGAFLDRSWEGSENLSGPAKKLFKQTKQAMKAASKLQIEVRQETLAMDRAIEQNRDANVDAQTRSIEQKSALLKKQLDAVQKAQQVLAKLGASQVNRITGDVEYLDVRPGMTGAEIRMASTKTEGVEKFLKSGGGNEAAADKKDEVLAELKAKTAGRRAALDAEAEKTAEHGSGELPHDVKALVEEFKSLGFDVPDDVARSTPPSSPRSSAGDLGAGSDHYSAPVLRSEQVNYDPHESADDPGDELEDDEEKSSTGAVGLAPYKTTQFTVDD